MAEENMPATEAERGEGSDELHNYELAFHILPTVAEGEVANVQSALRDLITKDGGTIDAEEAAARFELAYEIAKEVEGKRRAFDTSYFGWIRFTGEAARLADITEEIDARKDILRFVVIKLTREEVAHPFKVHEIVSKMPEIVDDENAEVIETKTTEEDGDVEVKEEELDESLEKITQ
jgi:ribosomal protein S6